MEYRIGPWAALAALVCGALVVGAPAAAQTAAVPAIRFHVGAEELAQSAGTGSARDADWVEGRSRDMVEWWQEQGPAFLARAGAYAGLAWPYADIEVYLVRRWPVVSIEYPLVLTLGEIGPQGSGGEVPDDEDLHVLLLAHQLTHYLLDDPGFLPRERRAAAYEHPFLAPGDLEVEAMVNWLVYAVLEGMWGKERLDRATGRELWRAVSGNHAYVTDELMPRWRLGPQATLAAWLASNPRGSEIFRVHEAYARQRREPETSPQPGANVTATEYGIDLGASFDGTIFVAFVDAASAADRAGVRQGDVLATVEGRAVAADVAAAQRQLELSWADNGEINLSILRSGREVFLTVERR